MSNISFSELRAAISKACSTNSTESIDGIYGFSVDMAKLDEILREKKSNLYSLGFKSVVESKVPGFEDIQNITEYMRDEKTISNTFNGKVQVCEFMLFLKENLDGPIDINYGDDDDALTDEEIFNLCNVELDKEFILGIIKNLPMYKILIVREFSHHKDNFKYNIFIRSNYQMVTYYKQFGVSEEDSDSTNKHNKNKK